MVKTRLIGDTSPACILSFVVTALARGELREAWAWNDTPDEQDTGAETRPGGTSRQSSGLAVSRTNSSTHENGTLGLTGAGKRAAAVQKEKQ
jgi:minor histocompatibility antigen H13